MPPGSEDDDRRGERGRRRRGFWRAVALAGVVFLLTPLRSSPLSVGSLILIPAALQLMTPGTGGAVRIAAAAWLLALSALGVTAASQIWFVERGWAVLLGGGFVVATALMPSATLFGRALTGVSLAAAVIGVAGLVQPELVANLEWRIVGQWEEALSLLDVGGGRLAASAEAARALGPALEATVPARLALASLAALGVASYVAGRVEGRPMPLGPLRGFRFHDQLVWVLIAGLAMVVLPLGVAVGRAGLNLAVLMSGLYVARGVAVLVWVGNAAARSRWSVAVWVLAAILLYPVTLGTAFVMGLSDTWLDLRSRLRVQAEGE